MIVLKGDGECRCRFGVSCGLRDDEEERILPQSHGAVRHGGPEAQSVVGSHLPTEGSLCACHSRRSSSCDKGCLLV